MEQSVIKSLSEYLKLTQIVSNLSRQKMLLSTLCALLQSNSVSLAKMAEYINDKVETASNETRLRDFFREVEFNYEELAKFLYAFLVSTSAEKVRLSIDRTNWEFGTHSVNILMIVASKGQHTVPLFWELLDNNGGNSNSQERIDLLQKCIDLLGGSRIGLLLGDREFIGIKWIKHLKINKINFCVRVPKSHYIHTVNGEILQAESIWNKHKKTTRFQHCMVDGVWGCAVVSQDAKGELLFLFSNANVNYLEQFYKKRWTIETVFQSFKSRGFNLEQTHIKINERLKKLVGIVSMAYAFCTSLGIFRNDNDKPIKIKNHKRKTNSFFRYGLDFIKNAFKKDYKYHLRWIDLFKKFIQNLFVNNSFSTS
jgi:transposase